MPVESSAPYGVSDGCLAGKKLGEIEKSHTLPHFQSRKYGRTLGLAQQISHESCLTRDKHSELKLVGTDKRRTRPLSQLSRDKWAALSSRIIKCRCCFCYFMLLAQIQYRRTKPIDIIFFHLQTDGYQVQFLPMKLVAARDEPRGTRHSQYQLT